MLARECRTGYRRLTTFRITSLIIPNLAFRIGDKIKLQRTLGNLTEEEASAILTFKEERDRLFHRGGLYFPNFRKEEKDRLMRVATEATDASYALYQRASK